MAVQPNVIAAALTAVNQAATLEATGEGSWSLDLRGTFVGTVVVETSIDGTNWAAPVMLPTTAGAGTATVANATAPGAWVGVCVDAAFVRARCSAYTSGTITATLRTENLVQVTHSMLVGTPAVTLTSGTVTAVTTLTGGAVAEDAATTSNPIVTGGVVRSATTPPITFAAGDAVRHTMTSSGAMLVTPYSTPEATWSSAAAAGGITNTTDVVLAAAAGASLRRYITGMTLSNNSATATEVVLKDGATVIWRGHLPANAPNVVVRFATPLRTSANAALNVACITTAAAVYVNAQGFTAP